MRIVERWRAWVNARGERVAAAEVAAWAEIEQHVRGAGRGARAQPHQRRLSPTADDLAAIANPDRRPPADHHPRPDRRRGRACIAAVGQPALGVSPTDSQPHPRSAPDLPLTDLLARIASLGTGEIDRMTAVTATTIDWCVGMRAKLHQARRELVTAPPAVTSPRARRRTRRAEGRRASRR